VLSLPESAKRSAWLKPPAGAESAAVWTGPSKKIEVAYARFTAPPKAPELSSAWAARQAGSKTPVLLVWEEPSGFHLAFGTSVGNPRLTDISRPASRQATEALIKAAVDHADPAGALAAVDAGVLELSSRIPGLRNGGLVATHQLAGAVRARPDWAAAAAKAKGSFGQRRAALLKSLGFEVAPGASDVLVLSSSGAERATAVLVNATDRRRGLLDAAFREAESRSVDWVMVIHDDLLTLHPARAGVGLAGRGPLETFVEINLSLLGEDDAAYLWLLFSHEALAAGGSLSAIVEGSRRYAAELGKRLRERIYHETVPHLVAAVAQGRKDAGLKTETKDLPDVYHQALTFLFRLLFLAYAEDRDLLPVTTSDAYRAVSLTDLAEKLLKNKAVPGLTSRVQRLFDAVDKGDTKLGVPPYNGGLFSSDAAKNAAGAALAALTLPEEHLEKALRGLLLDTEAEERGPVDFRSLEVREFGTIYEGLLESELSIATTDLVSDKKGELKQAPAGVSAEVKKGSVYLHNKSGARKAAGAYYTPAFAVDHLIKHSLDPQLDAHCDRVLALAEAGDLQAAAEEFFNFRVADLAMGSGHFLVAAADRIAARLAGLHGKLGLDGVDAQLGKLRDASREATGSRVEITDLALIRRIVARRCVYGADINPMSAELTRLSLWIHTFIPGLPMSYLGHNLRSGNSLTGIGTFAELAELLDQPPAPKRKGAKGRGKKQAAPLSASLFGSEVRATLAQVSSDLLEAATLDDATVTGVHGIEDQMAKLVGQAADVKALCDILVALRAGRIDSPDWTRPVETVIASHGTAAAAFAGEISALHFPVVWPEVFSPARDGFDVCIGNPPWEKVKVEEHAFWARYRPGLRGLSKQERDAEVKRLSASSSGLVQLLAAEKSAAEAARAVLASGPYRLGSGDPDLYQAFCWRNWQCVSPEGRIGMVLPRGALSGSGAAEWRAEVYDRGEFSDVAVLTNNKQWVFNIHPQFTVALVSIRRGVQGDVRLRGPFRSLAEFTSGVERPASPIPAPEFRRFASGGAFPQLPSSEATEVYRQMRLSPRFDSPKLPWAAKAATDMHATGDSDKMCSRTATSLPVWAGKNFNRWQPEVEGAEPYAWAEPTVAGKFVSDRDKKRTAKKNAVGNKANATGADSPKLFPAETAPESVAADEKADIATPSVRVAFRCITNATNRRTVIAAAIPAARYLQHSAGFLRFEKGEPTEQAALLGVLCSTTLDWFARRIVESGLTFEVLNSLPVPRLGEHQQRVAQIAGLRTARADKRLNDWAEAAGADLTETTPNAELDVELDALVAYAYGLTEEHLDTIWATYGPGADDLPDLDAVKTKLRALSQDTPGEAA
jgi:hypothetical protein